MGPRRDHSSDAGQPSEIFADFLARVEAGDDADFEELCKENAQAEKELRLLHRDWQQFRHVLSRLGLRSSLSERIRDEYGLEVDLEAVVLEGQEPAPESRDKERSTRRYRVHGRLGRGGQGEVLHVWDENLKRSLAMKVARARRGGELDSRTLARLLEEAQVTGQLDHPGIVPIHELGLDARGQLYFTMKLVKGRNLNAIFELAKRGEQGWSRTRALGTLLRVCEAMAYAHAKGVVHRDLKPDNIMVGRFGEAYVMDWGLARVLGARDTKDMRLRVSELPQTSDVHSVELLSPRSKLDPESPLVTVDGDVLGTPAYMAPEQARGALEAIGPASDVYSLGAILYHSLAEHPPFYEAEGVSPQAALLQLLKGPPTPISKLAPEAPPPLVAICEKAMARDPERRYASTEELAEDLRAYLENRVVQAYETGAWAEARNWVVRNKALAASLGAAAVLAIAGVAVTLAFQQKARSAAERGQRDSEFRAYVANLALAHQTTGEPAEAQRLLENCPESLRGWEWHHVAHERDPSTFVLAGHEDSVHCVALSPDLSTVASSSQDGTVRLWDLETGECARVIEVGPNGAPVHSLAFARDGERIVTGSADRFVRVYEPGTPEPVLVLGPLSDEVRAVDYGPDGRIAAACLDGQLVEWSQPLREPSGKVLTQPESHIDGVHSIAYVDGSPPGLFSATRAAVTIWNLDSGRARTVANGTRVAAFTPGGVFAWQGLDQPLYVGGLDRQDVAGIDQREKNLSALALDESGARLASGGADGGLTLWDIEQRTASRALLGHTRDITSLGLAGDGSLLVSGSLDHTVRVWQRGVTSAQAVFVGAWPLLSTQFLTDERLAMLSAEGRLLMLDARTGEVLRDEKRSVFVPTYQLDEVWTQTTLKFSPALFTKDGTFLVLGDLEGQVTRIELDSLRTEVVSVHEDGVAATDLDIEERHLATGSRDGSVRIWTWPDMQLVASPVEAGNTPVSAISFTADARQLAWGTEDGNVHVWDLERAREVGRWSAHTGPVRAMSRAAEDRLVTAGNTQALRLWSIERRETVFTLTTDAIPDASFVNSIALSPDGSRLVAGNEGGRVVVWETDPRVAQAWNPGWGGAQHDFEVTPSELDPQEAGRRKTVTSLVGRLFERHLFPDDVLRALGEEDLDDFERLLAARLVQEKGDLSVAELIEIAWDICLDADRSPRFRQKAVRAAAAAYERDPTTPWHRVVLSAAELRSGQVRGAEATLAQALGDFVEDDSPQKAIGHALRALALYALGHTAEARTEFGLAHSIASASGVQEAMETVRAFERETQ